MSSLGVDMGSVRQTEDEDEGAGALAVSGRGVLVELLGGVGGSARAPGVVARVAPVDVRVVAGDGMVGAREGCGWGDVVDSDSSRAVIGVAELKYAATCGGGDRERGGRMQLSE